MNKIKESQEQKQYKSIQNQAINILNEISNQQVNYKWDIKQKTNIDVHKRRNSLAGFVKKVKLPLLMNKKIINNHNEQINICKKKTKKQRKTSIKGFFQHKQPNTISQLSKYQSQEQQKQNGILLQKKRQEQLCAIKSWLRHKQLQCKSLNNLIIKVKEKSINNKDQCVPKFSFMIKAIG